MPDPYRADHRMPRATGTARLPRRSAAPDLSPCGRPGFDGACARRRSVSRGGRRRSRPTAGLAPDCPAGMPHVSVNPVFTRQAVNNRSLVDLLTDCILAAPMLMAQSLTSNLLFRAVRSRVPTRRANRWIYRGRTSRRPLKFPEAALSERPAGLRKPISGCHRPTVRLGNNLINLINVFQLMPLLARSPLVPPEVVCA